MVSPQILDCLLPIFDSIQLEMTLQQTQSSKLSIGHAPLPFLKAECLGTQKVGQVLETSQSSTDRPQKDLQSSIQGLRPPEPCS